RHVDELAVGKLLDERIVARLFQELGNPRQRAVDVPNLPVRRPRRTMENLSGAIRIDVELKDRRALRAERALVVGTSRVAFDVHDLAVDSAHQGGTADGAVGTETRGGFGSFNAEFLGMSDSRSQVYTGTDQAAKCCARTCGQGEAEKILS